MDCNFNRLPCNDLFWERIQESRQNETISYLMFIAGAVFFIGGLLETITSSGNTNWFLFIPYKIGSQTNNLLGLFMVLNGFMLLVFGLSSCIYYNFSRSFYLNLLIEVKNKKKIPISDRGTKAFSKELFNAQRELGDCKTNIINHFGFDEEDSIHYCKLLGKNWRELVEEEKLLQL